MPHPFFPRMEGGSGFLPAKAEENCRERRRGRHAVRRAESRGGAWSEDDTIVSHRTRCGGRACCECHRLEGGQNRWRRLLTRRGDQLSPQNLPGGKAVLYTAILSPAASTTQSRGARLPSGERKVVQRGGYHGRYVMSGHLVVYPRRDALCGAVRPGPARGEGSAGARTRRRDIERGHGRRAVLRVTNGTRLFVRAKHRRRHTAPWMDQEGKTTRLRAWPANWLDPLLARGRLLAMEIREGPPTSGSTSGSGHAHRLTSDPVRAMQPVWTPDGRRIVFASPRAESRPLTCTGSGRWDRRR